MTVGLRRIDLVVLLCAAAASLLLRLIVDPPTPNGDSLYYLQLAQNVAGGRGLVVGTTSLQIEVWALFPPLYPLLLSLIPVTPLNFAIDIAAAGSIVWLGRATNLERASYFAAALYLLLPSTFMLGQVAHKEGLAVTLTAASAALAIERRWAWLGVAGAALSLTQPSLAPLAVLLAIAFIPPKRWLACAVVAALVMLPWWIRNWIVLGAFVPLTTSGGLNLWVAATGNGVDWRPYDPAVLRGNEIAITKAAGTEAWRIISSDPLAYVVKSLEKTLWALALTPHCVALLGAMVIRGVFGKLVLLALAHLFLFQMWFELGSRHLAYLIPLGLLAFAALVMRHATRSTENHDPIAVTVMDVSLSVSSDSSKKSPATQVIGAETPLSATVGVALISAIK